MWGGPDVAARPYNTWFAAWREVVISGSYAFSRSTRPKRDIPSRICAGFE
jgi:hypothetical protein